MLGVLAIPFMLKNMQVQNIRDKRGVKTPENNRMRSFLSFYVQRAMPMHIPCTHAITFFYSLPLCLYKFHGK